MTHQPSKPRIYLSPPHVTAAERELLLDAFDSNWIAPLGPHVDAFESEFARYVNVPHAVALSSGTAALHLALVVAGIGPGDEVLVPTFTFIATANSVRYVGATPVFIDSERRSWNIDPQLVEEELRAARAQNRPVKAVIAVDILGQCADYDALAGICQRYGVCLIEDAAEGLGATYRDRPAGSLGDMGCFSFNGNKIITTSGGGMFVTHRADWAAHARKLASQAREPAPHYEHQEVGYNYRLSNLLAAVGRGQLANLDDRVNIRRANFEAYAQALGDLPGVSFMPEPTVGRATRWLTCMLLDPHAAAATPEEVRLALEAENIEARPAWKPMHLQPVYSSAAWRGGWRGGGVAEEIFRQGICLPSGSSMNAGDLNRVIAVIRRQLAARRATAA